MKIELFYFVLPDDEYSTKELKEILRTAFSIGKKSGAKAVLIEEDAKSDDRNKTTVLQGLLCGNIYRCCSNVKLPTGNAIIHVFAQKSLILPLGHFKHASRRVDVLRPLLVPDAAILTNADVPTLSKDVPKMKLITIGDLYA